MEKNKLFFFSMYLVAISMLTVNCTKNDNLNTETGNTLLTVKADVISSPTRADIKTSFVAGDKLGLFITKDKENTIYNSALSKGNNLYATYSDNGNWNVDEYYLDDTDLNVYAYYPHGEYLPYTDKACILFTLFGRSDILFGKHTTNNHVVNKDNPQAHVQLKHALAALEFFFRKQDYSDTGMVTSIEIRNKPTLLENKVIPLEIVLNLVTGEMTGAGDGDYSIKHTDETSGLVGSLTNEFPESGYKMFAYTNRPSLQDGDIEILFVIDGKEYLWELPENTSWNKGYQYYYYVCLSAGKLQLETVSIQPYEPGGEDSTIL